ncbi:MAG TPA: chemotaxis protein CheB, partial [Isosphaeraceae bacterium]|nr:chemotaxis protein CheB [Isosphaeraceae bacterium]
MRIAIVNDLAMALEILRRLVDSVPGYDVAWTAENGEEAVRKSAQDRPDVILMDLVMPVMDGVEATRRIMAESPCPILLVTSSVTSNFNMVYRAMGFGGIDAVNIPTLGPNRTILDGEGILDRIAKLARAQQASGWTAPVLVPSHASASIGPMPPGRHFHPVLAVGASTGGPEALACILKELPAHLAAAVVIIQHIAADFAPSLARWIEGQGSLPVRVVQDGDHLNPGGVLLAGTDDHLVLRSDRRLAYTADPVDSPYRPSVDVFFNSLAAAWPRPGIAVLLTG